MAFAWRLPRRLPHYEPWHCYCKHALLQQSYRVVQRMPMMIWPHLVTLGEKLQSAEERDAIYQMLQQNHMLITETGAHQRSWYTCKRESGIVDFIFPAGYTRLGSSPRFMPTSRLPGEPVKGTSTNKPGLLGVGKTFRFHILKDIAQKLAQYGDFSLFELDIRSCHIEILVGLRLGTPNLERILDNDLSIWNEIIKAIPAKVTDALPKGDFVKGFIKHICYKTLQGVRTNTIENIHETLAAEERGHGISLLALSEELHRNPIIQEFDRLNVEIKERYEREKLLPIYTPFDERPVFFTENSAKDDPWESSNLCRAASQILTGIEVLEIMTIVESLLVCHIPWIPLSLHHDGFCFLALPADVTDENLKKLSDQCYERLEEFGCCRMVFEITKY